MNDSAITNQHVGAQNSSAFGQGSAAEQPFVAPSPIAPNTPQINPAALPYNQNIGQGGPSIGSAQPLPPQAQNGRWVPIDAPVTGLPSGVGVGQPIQGADGQIYCYGAGSTEFGSLSSNAVKPIATPSDIIQLPPIVQPIAMVPYTTMNQPLLQYNPNGGAQNAAPQMPAQFSYPQQAQAQQAYQTQQLQQTQSSQQYEQAQQSKEKPQKQQKQNAYVPASPKSAQNAVSPSDFNLRPLPMMKKSYRGLSFIIMFVALAVLVCSAVLPYTSWLHMSNGVTEDLPTYKLIASVFIQGSSFYDVAASQVGYYAYGLIACAVLSSIMFLAIFIQNLIYLIKGKNPRCVSIFAIIALVAGIVSGVMIYLIQCGIDPTYSGNFNFLKIFNHTNSDILWGLNPFIVSGVAIILFILPFFARKNAFFTPPPALVAEKGSNNIIRSY